MTTAKTRQGQGARNPASKKASRMIAAGKPAAKPAPAKPKQGELF